MNISGKQFGVAVAVLFSVLLLILPKGGEGKEWRLDPAVIDATALTTESTVTSSELNRWILERSNDFTLIDIRRIADFESGHIPGAMHIPVSELMADEVLGDLRDKEIVIIYSNGNTMASKAWGLLRAAGIRSFVLRGGYNHWGKFPESPGAEATDDELLVYYSNKAAADAIKGVNSKTAESVKRKPVKKSAIKKRKKKKKRLEGC